MRGGKLFTVTYRRRGYGTEHVMRVLGTSASNAVDAVIDYELSRGYDVVLFNGDQAIVSAKQWKF
jgi:hypothetical protein